MSTNLSIIELARELNRVMAEMRFHLRQHIQSRIKEHEPDITFELLEVVHYLHKKDGANQQELADMLFKDKSSMTYIIDNLVKRELVARLEDEHDKRSKRIFLTEKGSALIASLTPWITEIYEKATNDLRPADIERCIVVIKSMNQNLTSSL